MLCCSRGKKIREREWGVPEWGRILNKGSGKSLFEQRWGGREPRRFLGEEHSWWVDRERTGPPVRPPWTLAEPKLLSFHMPVSPPPLLPMSTACQRQLLGNN